MFDSQHFLDLTSTLGSLAQGHNMVTPVGMEPMTY